MDELQISLIELFERVNSQFLKFEKENILNGVSERNLCSRMSIYFHQLLPEYGLGNYFADTEYNRKQNGEVKTMLDDMFTVVTIQCDLIIHSRGEIVNPDNLIAIEMKKSYNTEKAKNEDRKRVRTLTRDSYDGVWTNDGITHPEYVCGYKLGVYIELDGKKRIYKTEFYQKGEKIDERVEAF